MTVIEWKLDYTQASTGSTSTLTEFYDPVIGVKSGDGNDSFSFKVNNIHNDFDLYFEPNSKIEISRRLESSSAWSSSDILMNGAIRQVPSQVDGTTNMLRVSGYNYSESVNSVLVFVDGNTTGTPVNEFLQNAVATAKIRNPNFPLNWHPSNPTLTSGLTAFPSITDKVYNKTLNYVLEKYSKDEFTGDGDYYYYVDSQNYLVWAKKDTVPSHTFDSSNSEHKSIKISRDVNDVKNYVIVKGGYDPEDIALQVYVPDYSSIGKNGFRYYIFTDETTLAKNNLNRDLEKAGVTSMSDATYPFSVTWGSGTSYSSYSQYVTGFRDFHKTKLREMGLAYIKNRRNGKLKIDIVFQAGMKTWGLGQLIEATISSLSSGVKKLRVDEVQYTTTTDTFTLVEDIGTI